MGATNASVIHFVRVEEDPVSCGTVRSAEQMKVGDPAFSQVGVGDQVQV